MREIGFEQAVVDPHLADHVGHVLALFEPEAGIEIALEIFAGLLFKPFALGDFGQLVIERFHQEVCEELNVETVSFAAEGEELVHYTLRPNLPKLGKKLGKRVKLIQDAMAQLSAAEVKQIALKVLAEEPVMMPTTEGPIELLSDEILLSAQSAEGLAARTEDGLVVGITTEITPELRDRGIAREVVRAIGELRKKAGCKVSDRVSVGYITTDETTASAMANLSQQVESETQSSIQPTQLASFDAQSVVELDDATIELQLKR